MLPELTDHKLAWGVVSGFYPRTDYPIDDRIQLDKLFDEDVQHSFRLRRIIQAAGLDYTCIDGTWVYRSSAYIFDRAFLIFANQDNDLTATLWNIEKKVGATGSIVKPIESDEAIVYLRDGTHTRCPLVGKTPETQYSLLRVSDLLNRYKQIEIGVSLNAGFMNAMLLDTFCKRLNGSPVITSE